MTFLVIDNYDSFTYNLVHYLGELGAELTVKRNNKISVEEVLTMRPEGVVISPGPGTPVNAGICIDLINKANGSIPILGVCLGHQAIGEAYGGKIIRAKTMMHGKTSKITHDGTSVFRGINEPVTVTRYHSLTIEETSVPDCLRVTATSDDGCIMGIEHKTQPLHGVQFHPESIRSEHGHTMLKNFLDSAAAHNKAAA